MAKTRATLCTEFFKFVIQKVYYTLYSVHTVFASDFSHFLLMKRSTHFKQLVSSKREKSKLKINISFFSIYA